MENETLLREGERLDDTGFSGYRLIQKPGEFCYGVDAVLLSDFARVPDGGSVCDLGTGTGIIPLILAHKTTAARIVGVEIQEASFERACRSARLNGLEGRLQFLHNDVLELKGILPGGSFDAVVSNPPYMAGNTGLKNVSQEKWIARHETTASLEEFIAEAYRLLKDKGSFYLVHRPSRLTDIMALCRRYRLEPKRLRLVAPRLSEAANILLLHCVKYGNPELKLLPPLAVYGEGGEYTDEIMRMYER